MAMTWLSESVMAYGTTTVTPVIPTSPATADGDVIVCVIGCKTFDATVSTPTGWTKVGVVQSGTTASTASSTAGTGSVALHVYWRRQVGATAPANTQFTVTNGNAVFGKLFICYPQPASTSVTVTMASGTDTVANTAVSIPFGTNLDFKDGDQAFFASAWSTATAGTWSAPTLTLTGKTAVAPTALTNQATTTNGADISGRFYRAQMATTGSGTQTAAGSFTATSSVSAGLIGAGVVIRVSDVAATPAALADTLTDEFTTADTTKWATFDANRSVTGGNLQLNGGWHVLSTTTPRNMLGSHFGAKIVQLHGNTGGESQTIVKTSLANGDVDVIQLALTNLGTAHCLLRVANDSTNVTTVNVPTGVTHARIRVGADRSIVWEVFASNAWTTLRSGVSAPAGWNLANMHPGLQSGNVSGTPGVPALYDSVGVYGAPAPAGTWTLWNGTAEESITFAGIWDGTAIQTGTFSVT